MDNATIMAEGGMAMEYRTNRSGEISCDDWEDQALEHGWIPPECQKSRKPPKEHNRMLLVMVIGFLIVLLIGANRPQGREQQTEGTVSTVATRRTPVPGSAEEAVVNGTLTFSEIVNRAEAIGWSTTAWQEWYYIANKTGTTMEAIEEAAYELNKRLAADEPELYEALEEIGISVSDAKAMKPEELFEKVMYGIMSIEN